MQLTWLRTRKAGVAMLAALGVASSEAPASAFCRTTATSQGLGAEVDTSGCVATGLPLAWKTHCIPVGVEVHGSKLRGISYAEIHAALLEAQDTWANADCAGKPPSLQWLDRGKMQCDTVEFLPDGGKSNNNIVMFRDHWPYEGDVDALPTVTFRSESGEILDVDIELNSGDHEFSSSGEDGAVDLETSLVHNLGHLLGIAHSPEDDSVMNSSLAPGQQRRELSPDDAAAVCELFPPEEVFECAAEKVDVDFTRECAAPETLEGNCQASLVPNASGRPGALWLGLLGLCAVRALRRPRAIAR
jgi:Matrixin